MDSGLIVYTNTAVGHPYELMREQYGHDSRLTNCSSFGHLPRLLEVRVCLIGLDHLSPEGGGGDTGSE